MTCLSVMQRSRNLYPHACVRASEPGHVAKLGKKKRKMVDLTEEEMPVSGGGSWKRSGELMFALLEEKQEGHFEAEKLAIKKVEIPNALLASILFSKSCVELQKMY